MCYHLMYYISDHHQCLSNRSFQKGNFWQIMLVFFVFYSPGDVFEAKVCLAKMQIGHKIILSCSGVLKGPIDFLFAIIQTYSEDKKKLLKFCLTNYSHRNLILSPTVFFFRTHMTLQSKIMNLYSQFVYYTFKKGMKTGLL